MSIKKQRRNTQTPVAVNNEAAAAMQQRCTEQEQALQHMARILRGIGDALDALRARVGQALSLSRKLPGSSPSLRPASESDSKRLRAGY